MTELLTMRQTTLEILFDRAYSSHLEGKQSKPAVRKQRKRSQDLPLFYIALGLSVCVYLGLLLLAPSKAHYEDWFPTIHNPSMHQGVSMAGTSSASRISR
jgi:hypothetical protein